jgi:hypothetical protein
MTRAALDSLIGDSALTAEQIAQIQETIVDTDALQRVESAISAYAGEAERLHDARLSPSALDELRELAEASISRTAWDASASSVCATRRTSLLRPCRSAEIGAWPMESSSLSSQSMASSSVNPASCSTMIVPRSDERVPVDDEDLRHRERAAAA